jgi:hypothetical protein
MFSSSLLVSSLAKKIENAAQLFRSVPSAGTDSFTAKMALIMAGIDPMSISELYEISLLGTVERLNAVSGGPPDHDVHSDAENLQRTLTIYELAEWNQDRSKKLELATAMKLAGWLPSVTTSATAQYVKCRRKLIGLGLIATSSKKAAAPPPPRPPPPPLYVANSRTLPPPLPLDVDIVNFDGGLISPMTIAGQESVDNEDRSSTVSLSKNSNSKKNKHGLQASPQESVAELSKSEKIALFSKKIIDTSSRQRKTSKQAQQERREGREFEDCAKSAYKLGSLLYDSAMTKENPLVKFQDADVCADAINKLFGIEGSDGESVGLVNGRQLRSAFRDGECGKSPPRRGRQG